MKNHGITFRMLAISAALALVFSIAMIWFDPLGRRQVNDCTRWARLPS